MLLRPPPSFPYHVHAPGFPVAERDRIMAAYRREEKAWQSEGNTFMLFAAVMQLIVLLAIVAVATIGMSTVMDAILLLARMP
jgi:hypothetical protein